ncbi:hypothetical protein [Roseateles sp.]|uniref:hypothetical protein n=1 Tax=Roseateles sp. TaxID=1971397 RepID=UPI003D0B2E60
MSQTLSLHALNRVLASIDAPRNGRALYALLSAFCLAGLMLASAESALAKANTVIGVIWAVGGLLTAFVGVNTTGLLLMDQARGRKVREVADAFHDALRSAPRVLLTLLLVLSTLGLAAAALIALLYSARLPAVGPALFALLVPLSVTALGVMAFSGLVLIGPLTGPSIWSGKTPLQTARMLARQLRHGPLEAGALMMAVFLMTALVSAAVSFVVVSGGRALALLMVWLIGIDVPAQQLIAGLFGYGLRSLGASGAPVATTPLAIAAQTGGGVVFAVALVLPTLVYLRGCCAVYLALQDTPGDDAAL